MTSELRKKLIEQAIEYHKHLNDNSVYSDEYIRVSLFDNNKVLVVEDGGLFHIHVLYCRNSEECEMILRIFLDLYTYLGYEYISINDFFHAVGRELIIDYDPLYSYMIYETRSH
ncbi:MAG: hypothetical protein QW607_10805 [Desulfurococcaceae archaeon]